MPTKVYLIKRYQLPALHQLESESYSEEMNLRSFGPCSRLHGHDYEIEVTLSGEVDLGTGLLVSRDRLDLVVKSLCIEPFVGTNLSDHFSHTTGEALALEFFSLLEPHLPSHLSLTRLTVNETAKNSFTVTR